MARPPASNHISPIGIVVSRVEDAVVPQLVQDRREHSVVELQHRVRLAVHDPPGQRRLVATHLTLNEIVIILIDSVTSTKHLN